MNNADLIVATLRTAGIDHGFGIPSGNVLPLMEAMRRGGLDFVLTAHEGSAGFAADVTGRLTGAPGLCIATLGPGATNLTTGVGNAWLDRSPLIAITDKNEAPIIFGRGAPVSAVCIEQGLYPFACDESSDEKEVSGGKIELAAHGIGPATGHIGL